MTKYEVPEGGEPSKREGKPIFFQIKDFPPKLHNKLKVFSAIHKTTMKEVTLYALKVYLDQSEEALLSLEEGLFEPSKPEGQPSPVEGQVPEWGDEG